MTISTYTPAANLVSELQAFTNSYQNMLSAANAFVAAGGVLTVDPNIGITSSGFRTSASAVLAQVTSFLATAPTSFPAP